jgi:hypothetical protein
MEGTMNNPKTPESSIREWGREKFKLRDAHSAEEVVTWTNLRDWNMQPSPEPASICGLAWCE